LAGPAAAMSLSTALLGKWKTPSHQDLFRIARMHVLSTFILRSSIRGAGVETGWTLKKISNKTSGFALLLDSHRFLSDPSQ